MKLSEAIRLGAMMKPQARFLLFTDKGTCTLGAALDAVGRSSYHHLLEVWPDTIAACDAVKQCLICGYHTGMLMDGASIIMHLNDVHGMTREAIADWIELNVEPLPALAAPIGELGAPLAALQPADTH